MSFIIFGDLDLKIAHHGLELGTERRKDGQTDIQPDRRQDQCLTPFHYAAGHTCNNRYRQGRHVFCLR